MRHRIFVAAAIAVAALALPAATPARAETYPYCGYDRYGWGGCSFATLDQCRAFISGANGRCERNPRFANGAYTDLPVRARR